MNLPITLPVYALSKKVVNQLRLYLYLKSVCSGHFKIDDDNVKETCRFLDYDTNKTFYKNLQWLLQHKWVTLNSITNNCRIISFSRLCYKLDIKTKTGVVFELKHFKHFRPFLYAVVIAWSIRGKEWHKRQPAPKKGDTSKCMSKPTRKSPNNHQMPNRYLAKILELDHSTISRYKKAASAAGYITVEHQFEDTQLPPNLLYSMQKYLPEEANRLVVHNGTVQRQLPDVISHKIKLRYRSPSLPTNRKDGHGPP